MSSTRLIKNLKWRTVSDVIKSETVTAIYKAITGLVPGYVSNLFTNASDRSFDISLRKVDTDLCIPRMTTYKGQTAISFRCAETLNRLPLDVKHANSHNSFKCQLINHLQPSAWKFDGNISFLSPVLISPFLTFIVSTLTSLT